MKTTKTFNEYLSENPQVYSEFKKLTLLGIHKGAKKLGAKQICEVIRWQSMITSNDIYKVNNSYVSGLARKFEQDFPQFAGIFNKRECRLVVN